MWELKKISDEEYHSFGGLCLNNPQNSIISATLLKDIFDRGLYEVLLTPKKHSEETLKNFKTGSLLHSFILEKDEFDKNFYTGEFDPLETREQVNKDDARFLEAIRKECKIKFSELLDKKGAEVTITGTLLDVKVKAKLDKFVINSNKAYIYDLKSTNLPMEKVRKTADGKAWEVAKTIKEYHYDLQMYFYKTLVHKWLIQQEIYVDEILTILVFASKADFKVREFLLSEETLFQGGKKFEAVFNQVRDFVVNGVSAVKKYSVI